MLMGYYLWVYMVIRYHGRVWYYCWQRECIVRYIAPSSQTICCHDNIQNIEIATTNDVVINIDDYQNDNTNVDPGSNVAIPVVETNVVINDQRQENIEANVALTPIVYNVSSTGVVSNELTTIADISSGSQMNDASQMDINENIRTQRNELQRQLPNGDITFSTNSNIVTEENNATNTISNFNDEEAEIVFSRETDV